jgi:outer membrane protein TolC
MKRVAWAKEAVISNGGKIIMKQLRNTFRTRWIRLAASSVFVFFVLLKASHVAAGQPDDPDKLAAQAIAANPALKSIEHQISALRHKSDSVQAWADPVFAVEYSNIPWDSGTLGDSPMSGVQFKLQQKFVLPGKNDRRSKVVGAESEVMKWELEEKKVLLGTMVKSAYWKLTLVRELRNIVKRHIDLTGKLIVAVRVKYQVGKVGQHELLQLEVLKQKLADDLLDFDRQEKELLAALNAALHREADTQVVTPDAIKSVKPEKELAALMGMARENRPVLKAIKAQVDWRHLAADQAAYERWPDITVWAGYRIRSSAGMDPGDDFFSVGLAVPLPFDYTGRSTAKEEEHLASARAADQSYQARLDEIRARLGSLLASWRATARLSSPARTRR